MWTNIIILSLVSLQRLVELYIAHRNTKKLMARGGFEIGSGHYPLFVVLHGLWLAGLWYLALRLEVSWPWIFAYLVLEAARGWIIAALGSRRPRDLDQMTRQVAESGSSDRDGRIRADPERRIRREVAQLVLPRAAGEH